MVVSPVAFGNRIHCTNPDSLSRGILLCRAKHESPLSLPVENCRADICTKWETCICLGLRLPHTRGYKSTNGHVRKISELQMMFKAAVVSEFEVLSPNTCGGFRIITKNVGSRVPILKFETRSHCRFGKSALEFSVLTSSLDVNILSGRKVVMSCLRNANSVRMTIVQEARPSVWNRRSSFRKFNTS
jgi:hypothetical protein